MEEIGKLIYHLTQKDAVRNAAKENSLLKVQLHNMQVDANKEKRDYLVRKGTNEIVQNNLFNEIKQNKKYLKTAERGLEDLGVVINNRDSLKPEEQTKDADDLFELTYNNTINELSAVQERGESLENNIDDLSDIIQDQENRISMVDNKLRNIAQFNERMSFTTKKLFESEMGQDVAIANWEVDEEEINVFANANPDEWNYIVSQIAGSNPTQEEWQEADEKARVKLRAQFSMYKDSQIATLGNVLNVQTKKANLAQFKKENSLDYVKNLAVQEVYEKTKEELDLSLDTFLKLANTKMMTSTEGLFLGMNEDEEAKAMKQHSFLSHLKFKSKYSSFDYTTFDDLKSRLEVKFPAVIKALEKDLNITIPQYLKDDPITLALYYTGQIDEVEKNEISDYDDAQYKNTRGVKGKKYRFVAGEDTKTELYLKRMAEVLKANERFTKVDENWNPFAGFGKDFSMGVLTELQDFFNLYAQTYQFDNEFHKNLDAAMELGMPNPYKFSLGVNYGMAGKDRFGRELDENISQKELDDNAALLQYMNLENLNADAAIEEIKSSGLSYDEFMKNTREKWAYDIPTTKDEALDYYKNNDVPTENAKIINTLYEIDSRRDTLKDEFLSQENLDTRLNNRRLSENLGWFGAEERVLHEQGADLIYRLNQNIELMQRANVAKEDINLLQDFLNEPLSSGMSIDTGRMIEVGGWNEKYKRRPNSTLEKALDEMEKAKKTLGL